MLVNVVNTDVESLVKIEHGGEVIVLMLHYQVLLFVTNYVITSLVYINDSRDYVKVARWRSNP